MADSKRDKEQWAEDAAKNPDDLDPPSAGQKTGSKESWAEDAAKNPDDLEKEDGTSG